MARGRTRTLALALITVALFLGASLASSTESAPEPPAPEAAAGEKIQEEVEAKLAERRKAMLAEADAALEETNSALAALEVGNNHEALEALARATGKLELIVARDPGLALAPVDVGFTTHDVYASAQAIRAARDRAEQLLEDGRVQEARALLSGLASEIVIEVTNLPLATYPDAIKAISPLIDADQAEEAKTALRTLLATLVVTEHVIPLPVARARHLVEEAETLAAKQAASEEDTQRATELLRDARRQLEMAELLGYGGKGDHQKFRDQIAQLERKLGAEQDTGGMFANLRKSLNGIQTSFFD